MATFSYEGRDGQSKAVSGILEAPTEDQAVARLFQQGIIPTKVTIGGSGFGLNSSIDFSTLFKSNIPLPVLVLFCRQLYSLLKAGVPLLRSIKGLEQNAENKLLKDSLTDVSTELANGVPLSLAMRSHPRVFNTMFVSMIQVSENTGRLDQCMLQLATYFEQELETRKQIQAAIRYPIIVSVFMSGALVILNIFVIPQFMSIFVKLGTELPLPTKMVMASSNFFVAYWLHLAVAMVFAWFGFRTWTRTAAGGEIFDRFKIKMPIFGSIINRAQLSRFCRTFALMLQAGVGLNHALQLSAEAFGNVYLEKKVIGMKEGIESGASVTATAMQSGIFTPLVMQMIAVGEETGQMEELLLEASGYYDREVDYEVKSLTAKIEPIMLVFIAVLVLILALAIFLPMWNLGGAMAGHKVK